MTRNYALPGKCMRNDLLQRAEFTVKPLLCKLCIYIDCASGCEATSSFTNSSPNGSGTDHYYLSNMCKSKKLRSMGILQAQTPRSGIARLFENCVVLILEKF